MRLIKPSYEIIEQGPGLQGIYDIIEKCGKISYKSEPKGGETAKKFVEARAKEGHGAVLEFGTVYLKLPYQDPYRFSDWHLHEATEFYKKNEFSKVYSEPIGWANPYYVTTNYRVLVENDRLDDLKYLCEPTEYHEKRYTVKFITDIGVGREFLRHRVMSIVQESTRYVNYMKEKFGEECAFVIPPWIPKEELAEGDSISWWDGDWVNVKEMKIIKYGPGPEGNDFDAVDTWLFSLSGAEKDYQALLNKGWAPQQARGVLPLATKTEFILCGFTDAWIHFFRLRSDIAATGKPHPQAQELANPLRDEFIERQYITSENLENDVIAGFDTVISDTPLK